MYQVFLSTVAVLVYGGICIIAAIFTLSIETYSKIEDKINFGIFSNSLVTVLDTNINFFDLWLTRNNKIIGPILVLLSLLDLKLFFAIILYA
jgi:hypothetical protein